MLKTVSTQLALASDTLSEILAKGNTSGPSNIAMDSGYGIDFSATAGTGTSELLDDYEEGTFTAVLGGSGGTSGQTYTFRQAKYTKVGNLVTCVVLVQVAAKGTITGNLQIQGLPFVSASYATISAPYLNGFTGVTGAFISATMNDGETVFTFYSVPVDGSSPTILTTTALSAAPQLSFTISYIV